MKPLKALYIEHKWRFALTLSLILLEAGTLILFPLFIGNAIDGAINNEFDNAIKLEALGVLLLIIGMGRRVFDSRFYAKIYQKLGADILLKLKDEETSVKTARLNMVKELVEFFENALPELFNNIIGLVGIMGILAILSFKVFLGCLMTTCTIFLVYWLSSGITLEYNEKSNNEWEKQVAVITKNKEEDIHHHLKEMMRWNIKLSDLEAMNFSISWLVALAFLIASIIMSIDDGITKYGALFALVMYVFQYIENLINLPFFYQNWLRLKEIVYRLEDE